MVTPAHLLDMNICLHCFVLFSKENGNPDGYEALYSGSYMNTPTAEIYRPSLGGGNVQSLRTGLNDLYLDGECISASVYCPDFMCVLLELSNLKPCIKYSI